jgi:hypothetical protein
MHKAMPTYRYIMQKNNTVHLTTERGTEIQETPYGENDGST